MAWTYNFDPSSSDVAAIRFEIQDTDVAAQLLADGEIEWAILNETGVAAGSPATVTGGPLFSSAARCLEVIAVNLSRQADTEIGQMKTSYANAAKSAADAAKALRVKASSQYAPYAGGLSESEKLSWRQNLDLVPPKFRRSQFDTHYGGTNRGSWYPPTPE